MTVRTEQDKNASNVWKFVHLLAKALWLANDIRVVQVTTEESPEFQFINKTCVLDRMKRVTNNEKVVGKIQPKHEVNWNFIWL